MIEPAPVRRRPFTLLDLMILVAGCTLGVMLDVDTPRGPGARGLAGGEMAVAVAVGLTLVGPLVLWRGYGVTGHGPCWLGEWLWLAISPMGVALFVDLWLGLDMGLLSAGSVAMLWVTACVLRRLARGRAPEARRPAPKVTAHLVVTVACSGFNIAVWAMAAPWSLGLLACAGFPAGVGAVLFCAAFLVLWVAIPIGLTRAASGARAPWTHYIGLALASGPAVFVCAILFSGI